MDDAGKDVKALLPTASDKSAPAIATARAVSRGASLMHDHSLLTASIWCGMVFSLALVLTAINVMPSTPVGYRVSTQVIASPQRLDVLKRQLLAHADSESHKGSDQPQLLAIRVLGDHAQPGSAPAKGHNERLTLLEVHSLWPARTSSEQVHQWLNKLSEPDERVISRVDTAATERFARWELQVAQHYLKHYRHTRQKQHQEEASPNETAATDSGREGTLVSNIDGPPARFASLTTHSSQTAASAAQSPSIDAEATLVRELDRAVAHEKAAAAAVQEEALKISGILSLAGSPRVRAQPGQMPATTVLSVLVLAFAGGAIGGWAHHRAQSGGIFYASEVARNMDVLGLPMLGIIHITGVTLQSATGEVQRHVTTFRRWAIKRSLSLTELIVLFWCMAIAIRLVLDPLWRAMLWDNPLAALSRLFLGLP